MYLTKEELIILQGLKNNQTFARINKKLSKPIRTCDPRIDSLCQKYGATDRVELVNKADLEKVSITDIEEIPYWEYENSQLVQRIPICKKTVKNLLILLEQVEDDKREFKLIYSSNKLNKFLILEREIEKFYLYRQRPISFPRQ